MGTIKVPVNLNLIADRLPTANYEPKRLVRNQSQADVVLRAIPEHQAPHHQAVRSVDHRYSKINMKEITENMHSG